MIPSAEGEKGSAGNDSPLGSLLGAARTAGRRTWAGESRKGLGSSAEMCLYATQACEAYAAVSTV